MASMEETEREELFERMNKYERSRIINLAEKHCAQMMDLIHRYNLPILLGTEKTWLLAAVQYLDGNNFIGSFIGSFIVYKFLFATLRPKNQNAAVINLIHNRTLGI